MPLTTRLVAQFGSATLDHLIQVIRIRSKSRIWFNLSSRKRNEARQWEMMGNMSKTGLEEEMTGNMSKTGLEEEMTGNKDQRPDGWQSNTVSALMSWHLIVRWPFVKWIQTYRHTDIQI